MKPQPYSYRQDPAVPPFDNELARQAMAYATDKQALIVTIWHSPAAHVSR